MVEENQKQNPNKTEVSATKENLFPFLDPKSFQTEELYQAARDEYLKSRKINVPPYETLEEKGKWGANKIKFKSGILENVVASFGKVSFQKLEDDKVKLFYEYEADVEKSLHPFNLDIPESKQYLEKLLGDFLVVCIEEQIKDKTVVFRGGQEEMKAYINKNENRTDNT
jgi:hypothetical protein